MAATEKLHPLLGKRQGGISWRDDTALFPSEAKGPHGALNLSPAWFQQGHEVTSFRLPDSSLVADFQLRWYKSTLRSVHFSEIQLPWNG